MTITLPITPGQVWIDVGAHLGEHTLRVAKQYPVPVTVYAFEPHPDIAMQLAQLSASLPNYRVIPAAISEEDGTAPFYLNRHSPASSLLNMNPDGLEQWTGKEDLRTHACVRVRTMRLETFLDSSRISSVALLKVDAQGSDLAVVRSAGQRLRAIERVLMEVQISTPLLYQGAASKEEVLAFMQEAGFVLQDSEMQSEGQEKNLLFTRTTL